MTKSSTLAVALAVTFAGAGAVAWACGPDFPTQMLDDRAATLAAVPQNTFAFEAKHLLPATDGLKAVEGKPGDDLPAAQGARVKALMGSTRGDEAYANGGDLPEDVRLYVAGAVAWHAAMAACPQAPESPYGGSLSKPSCTTFDDASLARAQSRFEAVLALPAADAVRRGAWAAYMLGEVHAARAVKAAGSPAFDGERDAAVKAFRQVRALVLAGASDAQGLAVASFGEEARQALYVHGKPCVWVDFVSGRDCGDALTPTDLKHAIALYAAQAGHDSDNAVRSLAAVAGAVLADPTQTAALIDGPVSQRLLVAYALARVEPQTGDGKPNPLLGTLVDAIVAAGPDKVAGADRLASLAYQLGRYDQAREYYASALRIAPDEPTVLSNLGLSYVQSKDLAKAEETLRRANSLAKGDRRIRENFALVVGLQGRTAEAERILKDGRPADEAAADVAFLKRLLARNEGGRNDGGRKPVRTRAAELDRGD
jgi:tetratricopeptide (TPR) repeat protein